MNFFSRYKKFHLFCLKIFVVLMLIGGIFCGYLYNSILKYERNTKEGALDYLITLLYKKDYEKLYEISDLVETQFNLKTDYLNYLEWTFGNLDVSKAVFKEMFYSDNTFTYYDMIIENNVVATVQVKEVDNGTTAFTPQVRFEFYHLFIETEKVHDFYVNGIILSQDHKMEETKNFTNFDTFLYHDYAPTAIRYRVDNLITEPEITVDGPYKVVKDILLNNYYVGEILSTDQESKVMSAMKKFAETFAKWTSEDAGFSEVKRLLYRDTTYYQALATFNNQFFSDHEKVRFENWQFTDFAQIGVYGVIGTVSFDYVVTAEGVDRVYKNTYQLSMMSFDDVWLVTSMSINNDAS